MRNKVNDILEKYINPRDYKLDMCTNEILSLLPKENNKIMTKELEQIVKPPIGLIPKWVSDKERLNEVRGAIVRYYDNELKIPIEWIEEYNELIDKPKTRVFSNPSRPA
jgi:hypothetical protein